MAQCKPEQQCDKWVCTVCGFERAVVFHRLCGYIQPVNKIRHYREQVENKSLDPDEYLMRVHREGRTLGEQLQLLDQCRACDKFRKVFCAKDRGCDKFLVYLIRLAKRDCENWRIV